MKVSVITATYNCEESVSDAIDSVLSQTYQDIEYIIVDGASTDSTLNIVNGRKSSIPDLKFVSEPDNGIYDALNKGIAMATGDIIGFLHADDIYASPTVIADVVNVFLSRTKTQSHKEKHVPLDSKHANACAGEECHQLSTNNHQLDSVYGDLEYVRKEDVTKVIRYWKSGECTDRKLHRGWMPPHPTFFVRREVYEKFGVFDTDLRIAADYDFMMRVLFKNKISTAYITEVLIKMRLGGASNGSLKNIIRKSREDLTAMRNNGMGGVFTLVAKNFSKLK